MRKYQTLSKILGKQVEAGRTWEPGDQIKFQGSSITIPIFPGLFFSDRMGKGHYYGKDGTIHWIDVKDAARKAKEEGVNFDYRDGIRKH